MGAPADTPPGTSRYLHRATALVVRPEVRITTQWCEVWVGSSLLAAPRNAQFGYEELKQHTIVVIVPRGLTLVEGEAPSDFAPVRTTRIAVQSPLNTARRHAPLFVWGNPAKLDTEVMRGEDLIAVQRQPDTWATSPAGGSLGDEGWHATGFSYAPTEVPYWIEVGTQNANSLYFEDADGPLLMTGLRCVATDDSLRWFIEMWFGFTELYFGEFTSMWLGTPPTNTKICAVQFHASAHIRLADKENFGLVANRPQQARNGDYGHYAVPVQPPARRETKFRYGV